MRRGGLKAICVVVGLIVLASACFAGDEGITVDPLGHPRLTPPPKLQAETPEVDTSATRTIKGHVADWSLFDLGIEYDEKPTPPPPKILIKKVRLGSWAARAGLEGGDRILRVEMKRNAYEITIDRKGKIYRAELSQLDSTKFAANTAGGSRDANATQQQAKTGTDTGGLKTSTEKPHSQWWILKSVDNGDDISTEVNLAECMPQPTDVFGRGQWDLLAKERSFDSPLRDAWTAWATSLRQRAHRDWPERIKGIGWADLHVVMRNGHVVDVSTLHNTQPGDFLDQAIVYARTLHSPYPAGSAVTEIHLEVKFRRDAGR